MKYSLNRNIYIMTSVVLIIVFIVFFLISKIFLGEYYVNHKKQQVIKVAEKLKKSDFDNIIELGEENNLEINILEKDELFSILKKTIKTDKEQEKMIYDFIGAEEVRKVFQLKNQGKKGKDRTVILIEKLNETDYLLIYSPVYSIGEAMRITSTFTFYVLLATVILTLILNALITKRISKPILEINNLAKKLSELNFSEKIKINRKDELGELANSINTMSDNLKFTIDDLKVSNERLKLEVKKEKEIDKMRREFIGNINHELKTPIALIKGFAEGLKDDIKIDKDYYISVIEEECDNMDNLVQRLLLLTKYNSEFEIVRKDFDIKLLISDILKRYKYEIDKKQVNVNIDIKEKFIINADFDELKIAIDNLFRNALSHIKNGEIITIVYEQTNFGFLFFIKNPCEFMAQESIEKLWVPFNKRDKARTRNNGSTGLGLSIVAAIMKKHEFHYGAVYENNEIKFYFYS